MAHLISAKRCYDVWGAHAVSRRMEKAIGMLQAHMSDKEINQCNETLGVYLPNTLTNWQIVMGFVPLKLDVKWNKTGTQWMDSK